MASNKSILQQNLLKLLLALFFLFSSFIYSQTIGDYRSIASGNWTNVNIWQYYNGTTWVAATYYPGQTGGPTVNQVSIQGGFSVTLTSNIPGHINSVIVGDGIGGTDTLFISAHTSVNTDVMIISSGGVIDWTANVILSLPSGSAFIVDGGYMDESNPCDAAKKLVIGGNTYSSCNGHGNGSDKPFSFNDLNDGGGSINVSPSSNGPICEGTVLNLYANPSGAGSTDSSNTYSWSGTGPSGYSFSSNLQNPVVLNLLAGSYTYTVTVVHSGTFTHSNSVSVEVYSAPVADAPADIDACESYVLPSLSVGNYYTGSGGTGVTLNAGDQITSTQTIYVFAQSGTTPNCTDENSFLITIEPAPAEPTDLECWETATFNDATCSWDVSGTQPVDVVTNVQICEGESYTWAVNGETYTTPQNLTIEGQNCGADQTLVLGILSKPTALITSTETELNCIVTSITLDAIGSTVDGTASYSWNTGETTSSIDVTMPGTYTVTVTNESSGCSDSFSIDILDNIDVPTALITSESTELTCIRRRIILDASSSIFESDFSFEWNTGETSTSIEIGEPGDYTVTITDPESGCTSSETITISQTDVLKCNSNMALFKTAEISGNGYVGDIITYTFRVFNTGNTVIEDITINDGVLGILNLPISPGTLYPGEVGSVTASYTIVPSDMARGFIENSAEAAGKEAYGPMIYDISDAGDDTIETPDAQGNFDGEPDNDPTVIYLTGPELIVYDAISPDDNDGQNDAFKIGGLENYPQNNVKIYNRWGVLVYDKDAYHEGPYFIGISEGRITIRKGDKLPAGVYYYVLNYYDGESMRSKAGPIYIQR